MIDILEITTAGYDERIKLANAHLALLIDQSSRLAVAGLVRVARMNRLIQDHRADADRAWIGAFSTIPTPPKQRVN